MHTSPRWEDAPFHIATKLLPGRSQYKNDGCCHRLDNTYYVVGKRSNDQMTRSIRRQPTQPHKQRCYQQCE
ncbi:hypothetical protein GCM10029964_120960 [Kibdelosporangium lantanae]